MEFYSGYIPQNKLGEKIPSCKPVKEKTQEIIKVVSVYLFFFSFISKIK